MRRTINAVIAFVLLVVASGHPHARVNPSTASARNTPADATRQAIGRAHALAGREEWPAAIDAFGAAIESRGFDDLSAGEQYTALAQAGRIAQENDVRPRAHRWLVRASGYEAAADVDWHRRLNVAYSIFDYADSARCITAIARRWPATLDQISAHGVRRVSAKLDTDDTLEVLQREFLDALFDARWTDDGVAPDELWQELVRLQIKMGNSDKAATVARRIAAPRSVLALLVDKRYDAITAREGFNRDIDQVAATALLRAEARVRAAPDRLDPLTDLQILLLEDRQFSRVLALSDELIAKVANGAGAGSSDDFAENYPWILDYRARALQGLGRWDEALVQRRKAARWPEDGGPNVSQALNLGTLYAELDRPADALELIDDLGNASDYGRMVGETIALMAAVTRGDNAAIKKHMAYLREHRVDSVGAWQDALLTTGPIDTAADLLIERLRNERWRREALLLVQDYAAVPLTPWRQRYTERLKQVIAMPRVQAEIAKVGRIEKLKLGPPLL